MRLTVHTDLALRMLMLLALNPKKLFTIEEIAERYGVSRNHMMKVAMTLSQAEFIKATRGRHGGVSMEKDPAEIGLGDVLRATEDNFNLVECFDPQKNRCIIAPVCGLKGPLEEALLSFLNVLDQYSLADLIRNPASMRRFQRLLNTDPQSIH